jgi:anaphase-promoting complex subunit 4
MLKMLPLMDALQDDTKPLGYVLLECGNLRSPLNRTSATDLFAFEGSKKRTSVNTKFPEVIAKWPTLPPDPLSASMKTADAPRYRQEGEEELDEVDDRNTNSILCAGDDMGNIHCFLDGSFPLGTFLFNTNFPIASMYKKPDEPTFSINIQTAETGTWLAPMIVEMTLLKRRSARDVARTSSTARELTWYIMRCVKEMQKFWYGQDLQGGARTMGPKWVEALDKKQTQFGRTSRVLRLTSPALSPSYREAVIGSVGSVMSPLDGTGLGSSQ